MLVQVSINVLNNCMKVCPPNNAFSVKYTFT
jgi:hypothetical protein